jgi:hypothetical protein
MEWLALLHVWLPLAIGWFIVHRLSAARDMDKARREMAAQVADDLVEVATSIFLAAQRYHTNKRERENERRLKIDLQDMGMRVQQLVFFVELGRLIFKFESDIGADSNIYQIAIQAYSTVAFSSTPQAEDHFIFSRDHQHRSFHEAIADAAHLLTQQVPSSRRQVKPSGAKFRLPATRLELSLQAIKCRDGLSEGHLT